MIVRTSGTNFSKKSELMTTTLKGGFLKFNQQQTRLFQDLSILEITPQLKNVLQVVEE